LVVLKPWACACNNMAAAGTQAAMNPISASRPPSIAPIRPAGAPAPRPPGAIVSQARYSRQAAWITVGAFSLPTVIAPWLKPFVSPRAYALRTLAAGMIYVDMIQPPLQVGFVPAPDRRQEALGLSLGMMFYIPMFALQAHVSNTWFGDPASRAARTARCSRQAWQAFCDRLPTGASAVAAGVPFNFVLSRVLAQMAAVGVGSVVAGAWQRRRGATLRALPQPAQAPSLRQRVSMNPYAYLAGIAAFAGPTAMTLRLDRAVAAGGLASPRSVALLTSAVVAACVATGMVHPASRPD
jgi:hypothetical protein